MTTTTLELTQIPVGSWTIDAAHSEIGFTARHLMSKVRGLFEQFEGQIVTGESSSASATIDLTSIDTRDEKRDAHLRSADFFDVEKFGQMTFRTTNVVAGGRGLLVTGDLTIKGVSNPVVLDVEFLGTETDPWGGTRIGFEGTATISRKEWGIDFNIPMEGGRLLVGDKVDLLVAVQAVLQPAE